jgi:uncharacterized membrane protein
MTDGRTPSPQGLALGADGAPRPSGVDGFNRRQRSGTAVRVLVSVAAGVVIGAVVGGLAGWSFSPLAGWVGAAMVFLAWTWSAVWALDASDTERLAQREDSGRALSDGILLLVAVVTLLTVALVIFRDGRPRDGNDIAHLALGVASIVGGWAVLHSVFWLKYASLYYAGPVGGVNFNQDDPPAYRDFAYLAFTVGMTFQVSDTNVEHSRMRRLVLGHALLAYLFGAVVIAVTVNLLASSTG